MTHSDAPSYLREAACFRTGDLARTPAAGGSEPRQNRYFAADSDGYRATLSRVEVGAARIFYTELEGGLVNAAAAIGHEIVIGSLVRGSARIHLNREQRDLAPSDAILFLPGDAAVQALRDTGIFVLRIPLADETLFRIKGRSFRSLQTISRWLSRTDSLDFFRLFQFFSMEYDRQPVELRGDSPQVRILANALVERTRILVERCLGDAAPADPTMLEVCKACDTRLAAFSDQRLSARELAESANCSIRQLYRAFDAVARASPLEYQLRSRLRQARWAITDAAGMGQSLAGIAERFGFRPGTRFARAYFKEFGETPAQTSEHRARLLERLVPGSPPNA